MFITLMGLFSIIILLIGGGYYYFTHVSKRTAILTVIFILNLFTLSSPMKILMEQAKIAIFPSSSDSTFNSSFYTSASFYLPIIIFMIINLTATIIVNKLSNKYGWDNANLQQVKENEDNENNKY